MRATTIATCAVMEWHSVRDMLHPHPATDNRVDEPQSRDRTPVLAVHDLRLDPARLGVTRGGRSIRLTAREFALLELLARYPGQIFPQARLIQSLWDADFAAESNVVEVYIRSLRRKIDGGRRDGLIETVRGSGYRLRAEEP